MSESGRRRFAGLVVGLLAGLLSAGAWAAEPGSTARPLRLCATETLAVPAALWRQAGLRPAADGGVDDFVLALVARRLSLRVELTIAPSRRCPLGVQTGQFDGVLGLSANAERRVWGAYPMREGELDLSLRYLRDGYSLYARRGEPWRWDGSVLHGGPQPPIGMPAGYSGVALVRARGLPVQETSAAPLALLRMLEARRFALVALPDSEAEVALARNPALQQALLRLSPALVERDYFLVLSRPLAQQRPEWAQRLWQALAEENQSAIAQQARQAARR